MTLIFFLGYPQMQRERLELLNITSIQHGSGICMHILCRENEKGNLIENLYDWVIRFDIIY